MSNFLKRYIAILLFGTSALLNASSLTESVRAPRLQDSLYFDNEPIDKRSYDDLKAKYSDDDFIYERSVDQSGWWTRFKQWLSDIFKDLFDLNSDAKASDFTDLALTIFYVVIFLLVVFFIVKAIINKEGKWVFGKSSDKSIIPVTDLENNIHVTDFSTLVEEAEGSGNYRLAIRFYYLWLLKALSEAELIDYDVEKTNSDYYYEITSEATKKEFSYTSYLYNYIWYGEFDIDDLQFQRAKKAFTRFLNTIKV
ncbi:hypothetical protein [Sediminibacter sp. Hel_I_10]|uniref:hypothetical protein n=1 Tax=Sediminibacter sp. Hel_I_10 TaxID=1392490 RepID=UPI00068E1353|nr:hypothetical protein [Sediminibacter sp. Hel_I_10]